MNTHEGEAPFVPHQPKPFSTLPLFGWDNKGG